MEAPAKDGWHETAGMVTEEMFRRRAVYSRDGKDLITFTRDWRLSPDHSVCLAGPTRALEEIRQRWHLTGNELLLPWGMHVPELAFEAIYVLPSRKHPVTQWLLSLRDHLVPGGKWVEMKRLEGGHWVAAR